MTFLSGHIILTTSMRDTLPLAPSTLMPGPVMSMILRDLCRADALVSNLLCVGRDPVVPAVPVVAAVVHRLPRVLPVVASPMVLVGAAVFAVAVAGPAVLEAGVVLVD